MRIFIIDPPGGELISRLMGMVFILLPALFIRRLPEKEKEVGEIPVITEKADLQHTREPDLLFSLSHQIKTPLSAILGFSELLKDPDLAAESRKIYIRYINASGKYLLELINNITDITKIETGQLYISRSGCRVNELLTDIHKYFGGYLNERGKNNVSLVLETGIKDEDYTLLTDQERLSQILHNLLENAVSFTDEGYIEFGYRATDALFIEFYVRDTGAGFSMERLETIMERFKSVADSAMRPFDTAALRINISKHLVNMLGGKLHAKSVLREGSTFTFTVPRNEVKVDREDTLKGREKKVHLWKDKQILIAEDVESNFIYLREILGPTKVQIQWAKNGREAVEMCSSNLNLHLVLMDILMPEMDGYEAARLVKQARPDLPVIAQTAYSLEEDDYKESLGYFDKYMIKPIWSHELLAILAQYLD
jgi:signal transduction histidine kinase